MRDVPKLLIALDCDSSTAWDIFYNTLEFDVGYKFGSSLLAAQGGDVGSLLYHIRAERRTIFWDSKYFDIPSQVASTIRAIGNKADMISVHVAGGKQMIVEAIKAAEERGTEIVGITKLTSEQSYLTTIFSDIGIAMDCGISTVVCPISYVTDIRSYEVPVQIITPGIRPTWYNYSDEHIKPATPTDAVKAGCDYIIVGRPILNNKWGYKVATKKILDELSAPVAQSGRGTTLKK